jgi:FtsP/CotA-like multicopper oxidase with cupredoxin domain
MSGDFGFAGRGAAGRAAAGLSRRRLLHGGAALGGLALGAPLILPRTAVAQGDAAHTGHGAAPLGRIDTPVAAIDQPLREPEVRRSAGGVLATTLRAGYGWRDVGGYRLFLRGYEGGSPGPTLRMQPGEVLRIRLLNDLPPNPDAMPANISIPHQFNTTNFHFHGAHASPSGLSDNVMRSMLPGEAYDIEIALPDDHTAGTYWYHPHHHGSADIQMASGMFGALIVEGDFTGVPEITAARERVLVLAEAVFDQRGMIEDFERVFRETATRFFTVNGQRRPVIDMRPGEVQRWRLVGGNYQNDILLALEAHDLTVVAYDGIQLAEMERRPALLMAPGQRADVLVKAGRPGTYELAGLPNDQGYPSPSGPVARVVVAGEPLEMALPAALPPPPFEDVRDDELTGSRTLVFSAILPETEAAGVWPEFAFLIDGKRFDPTRIDQRVRLGAVEEWTILNVHVDDHVFHIHTNPFQVTKVNGVPAPGQPWRDTVVVPRQGSVVFRSRFLDYTGLFMLHCHMMNHEELGMMQTVEIYE